MISLSVHALNRTGFLEYQTVNKLCVNYILESDSYEEITLCDTMTRTETTLDISIIFVDRLCKASTSLLDNPRNESVSPSPARENNRSTQMRSFNRL